MPPRSLDYCRKVPRSLIAFLSAFGGHLSAEPKYSGSKGPQLNKAGGSRLGVFRDFATIAKLSVKNESDALVDGRLLHLHGHAAPLLIFIRWSTVNII